jgi:hypothetical protein
MPSPRRRAVALALVALAATACSSTDNQNSPPPPASSNAAELLDFTAPLVGAGTVQGAELAGRDLAVWFWAPW